MPTLSPPGSARSVRVSTVTVIPPRGVYLPALERRLLTIWRTRTGSVWIVWRSLARTSSPSPAALACRTREVVPAATEVPMVAAGIGRPDVLRDQVGEEPISRVRARSGDFGLPSR